MAEDKVRVLRIVEYTGLRGDVEEQIARSLHGTKRWIRKDGRVMTIRVATIGEYPEILEQDAGALTINETGQL